MQEIEGGGWKVWSFAMISFFDNRKEKAVTKVRPDGEVGGSGYALMMNRRAWI